MKHMRDKTARLKTIRDVLRNLKRRDDDAKREARVLQSAVLFYEEMKRSVEKEEP